MRAKGHPELDAAVETLAAEDVWSLDSQLACARERIRRGDVAGAIRRLDDGRTIVNYITPNGPAEEAGITLGAEIVTLGGMPVDAGVPDAP